MKPNDITLRNGRVVTHEPLTNGSHQAVFVDDPNATMTDDEWNEYANAIQARSAAAFRERKARSLAALSQQQYQQQRHEQMTTSKHTPGPWKADEPGIAEEFCNRRVDVFDEEHGIVAEAWAHTNPGTMKANARLIAAAPDLLDALRECITDDPGSACFNTGKKTRRLEAISNIARAAIAKATGEQV